MALVVQSGCAPVVNLFSKPSLRSSLRSGLTSGLTQITDSNSSSSSHLINNAFVFQGQTYFVGTNGYGSKLFKYGVNGNTQITDINSHTTDDFNGFQFTASYAYFQSGLNDIYKFNGTTVTKINPSNVSLMGSASITGAFTINSDLIFNAYDNVANAWKIYRYDGTTLRTLADGDQTLIGFIQNSKFYFAGFNGHLYVDDGSSTTEVTSVVYDQIIKNFTWTGGHAPGYREYQSIFGFGSNIYFVATNGVGLAKLFLYDGTSVTQISNFIPGGDDFYSGGGYGAVLMGLSNSHLFIRAFNATSRLKLFTVSGATLTEAPDAAPVDSDMYHPQLVDGANIYFYGADLNTGNYALMHFNGTNVSSVFDGVADPQVPMTLVKAGAKVYYVRNGELYQYSGVGAPTQVSDLNPGNSDHVRDLTEVNGHLYFFASENGATYNFYSYDGSTLTKLKTAVSISFLTSIPNKLYFVASNGTGDKLYEYNDLTNQLQQVSNLNPNGNDVVASSIVSSNTLFFMAGSAAALYRYNGIVTRLSTISSLTDESVNGVYALGTTYYYGIGDKLYGYNGTSTTELLSGYAGIQPVYGFGSTLYLTATNNYLYEYKNGVLTTITDAFSRYQHNAALKLIVSDGTTLYFLGVNLNTSNYDVYKYESATLTLIPNPSGYPVNLSIINGALYFSSDKLFRYNGVLTQMTNINGVGNADYTSEVISASGKLYFNAYDSNTSSNVYFESDGTIHTQIYTDTASTPSLVALGNKACFLTGLAGVNQMIKCYENGAFTSIDTNPGSSDDPTFIKVLDGKLYFTAYDSASHIRLFSTDGVTATQISDLNPGSNDMGWFVTTVASINSDIYYTAAVSGVIKIVKFDGVANTVLDMSPTNTNPSYPVLTPGELSSANGSLFFIGDYSDVASLYYRHIFKYVP